VVKLKAVALSEATLVSRFAIDVLAGERPITTAA